MRCFSSKARRDSSNGMWRRGMRLSSSNISSVRRAARVGEIWTSDGSKLCRSSSVRSPPASLVACVAAIGPADADASGPVRSGISPADIRGAVHEEGSSSTGLPARRRSRSLSRVSRATSVSEMMGRDTYDRTRAHSGMGIGQATDVGAGVHMRRTSIWMITSSRASRTVPKSSWRRVQREPHAPSCWLLPAPLSLASPVAFAREPVAGAAPVPSTSAAPPEMCATAAPPEAVFGDGPSRCDALSLRCGLRLSAASLRGSYGGTGIGSRVHWTLTSKSCVQVEGMVDAPSP